LGAIRLPSDAFKREGTGVVTDIVFLRKRAAGEPAGHVDPEWLAVEPILIEDAPIPINRYFLNHPEMVLGTSSPKDRLYDAAYRVSARGCPAEGLRAAIARLPGGVASPVASASRKVPFIPPWPERHLAEGSFSVADDRAIRQIIDGQAVPVTY